MHGSRNIANEVTRIFSWAAAPWDIVDIATLAHLPFFRKEHHRAMGCLVVEFMTMGEEAYPIACGGARRGTGI